MSENKQTTDSELLLQVVGYNSEAFEQLYNRYSATIYSLIKEIVTNPKQAEKILLNVFSVFLKRIDHYSITNNNIFTWLTLLARNISIDTLKRMKFVEDIPIYSDDYEIEFILPNLSQEISLITLEERNILGEKIKSYKNQLTEVQNLVLSLIYFEGLNEEEIAKRLNVPSVTVRQKTLSIMETLYYHYTGKTEQASTNQELLNLIKLEPLGSLSTEERMLFNQSRNSDVDFLWKEYGEYQNLVALLSTSITLIKPGHDLNSEIKAAFTKILQGSDVDYPIIASEIPIVETPISPASEPLAEKIILSEVKETEKKEAIEEKEAGFHIKFRERDPKELSLLRKLDSVQATPIVAPVPVHAKTEKEIQFRDYRSVVKKPSVLAERKDSVLNNKEIIKSVFVDDKINENKTKASEIKQTDIEIDNDDPQIIIEEPKPLIVRDDVIIRNKLIPNSSINLKEIFKRDQNKPDSKVSSPLVLKNENLIKNKSGNPIVQKPEIKINSNEVPKEFQKPETILVKQEKIIQDKLSVPVIEKPDIKIKTNEPPREFRKSSIFVDKDEKQFQQKPIVPGVEKKDTTNNIDLQPKEIQKTENLEFNGEKIQQNKPTVPVVEKSDIKIKANEPLKEFRRSNLFDDKVIQPKTENSIAQTIETKIGHNEPLKEIQEPISGVVKQETPAQVNPASLNADKSELKLNLSQEESKKVIVPDKKNNLDIKTNAVKATNEKSEIKPANLEIPKSEDIKPPTKEDINQFQHIKPSSDRTNLKIRETVFTDTNKKVENVKQSIILPVKESTLKNEVVHSVSSITESINIEEILTNITDEKPDLQVLSDSESNEKEIIQPQKKLRRNIFVYAALFLIVVASSVFLYLTFQEAPVKVVAKKNNSEKLILSGQPNFVINNDYKTAAETENPEKTIETLAVKETASDEQIISTPATEIPTKDENKIISPIINNNIASIDDSEPTQIAAAKTETIVLPKETKKEEEPSVFLAVEEMPELVGGLKVLQNKIKYPEIAKRQGIEGKVLVQAIVDETGKVISVNTIKGIGSGCDEVAMDAIRNSTFTPGKQRGKNVKVQVTIPIVFKK